MQKIHNRHSIRIPGYDYSQAGMFFVTINVNDGINHFGHIQDGEVVLSDIGEIVRKNWLTIPDHFKNVDVDYFVVMPDHFHGIIQILPNDTPDGRRGLINQTPTRERDQSWILMKNPKITLGKIVRYFKAKSTREIRSMGYNYFKWQRNYHDRIIRNEIELHKIREYIVNNPLSDELKLWFESDK